MSSQSHRSDPRILGRRTLQRDHRILAARLRPGMAVLDVGCGTGAITAGIAHSVGPEGRVLGIDRDDSLLEIARREHAGVANLRFEHGDATSPAYRAAFEIVTAARTLQWIGDVGQAIAQMRDAALPGGLLVVLDYDHNRNRWTPEPPPEFARFYRAFLQWRAANSWDNDMASHLPALFRGSGLIDIENYSQDEVSERGQPEFGQGAGIWLGVIEGVGPQLSAAGLCTTAELQTARERYQEWISSGLERQTLVMRTVVGRVP